MSFTDQKPRIATQDDIDAPWSGEKHKNFRCAFCGHTFVVGEYWRWVFTNNVAGAWGNPTVCLTCDGDDVIERWKEKWIQYKKLNDDFWWFLGDYNR